MFPFVVSDSHEVVEEGAREVRGYGGVAAEAGDDIPGLEEVFKKGERKSEFFCPTSTSKNNSQKEKKKLFPQELTRSIAQLSM